MRHHHTVLKRSEQYGPPTVNAAVHRKAMWLIRNPSFDLLIVVAIGANCTMLVMTPRCVVTHFINSGFEVNGTWLKFK